MIRRLIALVCVVFPGAALAQGLAGSAVSGIVRLADGRISENAVVTLVDRNSGARRTMRTISGGVYRFENVDVGTYRLDARAIGAEPAAVDSVVLHLGDRLRIDITLGAQAMRLDDAVIRAGLLRDAGAGGPAATIAGRAARNIPLMNRDFVNLLTLSSQALGSQGLLISGQHARYNAIQIDGAAANDFFGVSVTPGSNSGNRIISPEAIEEVRILVAPFDVRMGGFAGGLINAVTRSGSNRRAWSTFAALTRSELIGTDTSGVAVPQFNQIQYGFTAHGPVIRDRLHYFVAADFQQRASTLMGLRAGDSTGVTEATALRVRNSLRDRFGFDPGGTEAPDVEAPTGSVFLKMSWHPRANTSIELTPSYSFSSRDTLSRSIGPGDGWRLSRSGSHFFSNTAGVNVKANYNVGPITNETIIGYNRNAFGNQSRIRVPSFLVQADAAQVYVGGGSTGGAQGIRTFQGVSQLVHNASWTAGNHTIVAGTQDYVVGIRDNFAGSVWGIWTFDSVDSLETDLPSRYQISLPARPGEPSASYHGLLTSVYLQDQWQAASHFRVSAGIRGETAFLPHPRRNAALLADGTLGNIDTRAIASGNWSVSPRVGFAWTIDKRRMLRGGIGYFTARPPFSWTTLAYSQTGETQSLLTCTASRGVPRVSTDVDQMPSRCTGDGGTSSAVPSVTYFAPDFHLPQSIKAALGFDTEIQHGWVASLDLIGTRTHNQMRIDDGNLLLKATNAEDRAIYARRVNAYGGVYRLGNYSGDRSISASARVRREWSIDKLIDVAYTYSRTMDVMGLTGFTSLVLFRNTPLDGAIDSRKLRRSARDIPHNLVATAIVPAGAGVTASLILRARSGTPWAFTVKGDVNADGSDTNDLVYVPRDSSDITLGNPATYGALNSLVESLGCARSQRGGIMQRNSCRNPSAKRLDGRLSKSFGRINDHRIEISADVFNIPNLVNHRWGIIRETATREDVPLLNVVGVDGSHNRPIYAIPTTKDNVPILPSLNRAVVDASRWSIQLGARYEF
jgi:hypothetical protein